MNKATPPLQNGKVYLVGAGPGDPGLLTLRAHELLAAADCVVYDYLVNPAILRYAAPTAEQFYVGKQGGQKCISQGEINQLLIAKAAQHRHVVRLKGGDPFIFGRGGEEALALTAAHVPWEAVPGVSSALGATAYAGIPLTFRGVSSSVAFITAHEDPAKEHSTLHWDQLATGADTLVVFMGVARIQPLVEALLAQGRPAATPVAVIRWGTYAHQEVYVSDLQNIAALVTRQQVKPPALIIVGEVVRLREQLDWFTQQLSATDK
jgi:uroporphyrinogen III methyltransferase/synthase